jgi:maltose operon protein
MKNLFAHLLVVSTLLGCASTEEKDNRDVKPIPPEATVCCSSYSGFSWTQLERTEDINFQINTSSPFGSFPEGESYFASFTFSELSKMVEVTISSNMQNKSVLAPYVVTLDKNFNVVEQYKLDSFSILYGDAFDKNRYETTLSLDASVTPYFVIYTDSSSVGQEIKIPHPAKVRAVESGEPLPIVTDLKYEHAYVGDLIVKIETLSLNNTVMKKKPEYESEIVSAQPESAVFYKTAIQTAVKEGNIPKALSLLDEAKVLNIDGAQEAFVNAINDSK